MNRTVIIFLVSLVVCSLAANHVIQNSRDIIFHTKVINTVSHAAIDNDLHYQNRISMSKPNQLDQYLVHVATPLTADQKRSMEEAIGKPFTSYIPHNTYLLIATQEMAKKAQSVSKVQWVGSFAPEMKMAPGLIENVDKELRVNLAFGDSKEIASRWGLAIHQYIISMEAVTGNEITIVLKDKKDALKVIEFIANQSESHFIEPEYIYESHNQWASSVLQDNGNGSVPFENALLDTSDLIVGLADTGLNWTSCFFPPGTQPSSTLNLGAEKIVRYITTYGDDYDLDGHGTAVGGTLVGNAGNGSTWNPNGILSNAKIHFTDIQKGTGALTPPANLTNLFQTPYGDSVVVFVAPFGSPVSWYGTDAQEIDQFMYAHTDFLLVTSAGNTDSSSNRSLSSLALSKNALVVGASLSSNQGMQAGQNASYASFINGLPSVFGSHVLASYSAQGPTPDGRIKPDVVSPGQVQTASKDSTCSYKSVHGTSYAAGTGAASALYVLNYLNNNFYPTGENAGAGNGLYNYPSSALMKAILINSAQPLLAAEINDKGYVSGISPVPNSQQGFGRIQLDQTLYLDSGTTSSTGFDINSNTDFDILSTGQSNRYCYTGTNDLGTNWLKATLVWTDPAADVASGHILVNDLDLVVIDQKGVEHRTSTSSNGDFDSFNNVEQVYIPSFVGASSFAIHIYARNIPVGNTQTYSLVVSGTVGVAPCYVYFDPGVRVCPGSCSGHGVCNNLGFCECNSTFTGLDCSLSPCPSSGGKVCAGNGYCDYDTSLCVCETTPTKIYGGVDCSATITPTTPVSLTNGTVLTQTNDTGISKGVLVGTVIAAFVIGAVIALILGAFIAVKYLERRRDRIMKERESQQAEMH